MFPNFYTWLEMGGEGDSGSPMDKSPPIDNSDDESSSLSEPQHEKGESSLTLNKLVEKRLKEMIDQLQIKGTADENQVLDAISYFLNKNAPKQQEPQSAQQQGGDQGPQPQNAPQGADLTQLPPPQSPPAQTLS
jgi:hypothetical protein